MSNFFDHQDSAKARSRAFYIAFTFAVIGAVIIFYFMLTGCFLLAGLFSPFRNYHSGGLMESLVQYSLPPLIYGTPKKIISLRPALILIPAITFFILMLSYYKTSLIKNGGGAYVAEVLGGVLIRKAKNVDEKRLLNVVEEMALASGLPRPRVYVFPKEWSINAVTAGLDHEDAIIAVTAGSLKHLDRDELQGVIAHEYAHILNGDYILNLSMAGWLYGLLFFSVQGRDMMGVARDLMEEQHDQERPPVIPLLAIPMYFMGLLLWVGGSIGKLAAELTQAAMSRQREQMADAFAVQFTRNPRGLAGALKKIAAFPQQGLIKNGQALMMKSFFIVSPGRLRRFLRSHPPLEDRIITLEPSWNGDLPEFGEHLWPVVNAKNKNLKASSGAVTAIRKNPKELYLSAVDNLGGRWVGTLVLGMLAGHVGQYDKANEAVHKSLELSNHLYNEIPQKLRSAVDDTGLVASLIAAIFIHDDFEVRERQIKIVSKYLGEENIGRALNFKEMMAPDYRLPLLGTASPTLGSLSDDARQTLARAVKELVAADGKLDLFELAALQILKKRLKIKFFYSSDAERDDKPAAADYLENVQASVVVILSVLARLGARHAGDEKIKKAFQAGMVYFNQWPAFDLAPAESSTSKELILALERLEYVPAAIKNTLILAAVSAALHDNYVSPEEYELLRALAAALDVPLPYFSA